MKEHNIKPEDVESVLIETTTRGADILSDPSKYTPKTKETADHSLPYCIAVAIAKGNVLPSDFESEALKDPLVLDLIKKIKVVANPEIDSLFPRVKRAICTITTKDGDLHKKQEDFAKGSKERPLTDEELISKFRSNACSTMSDVRMDKIVKATFDLENFANIGDYIALLVSEK